ncbi:MAG: AAA family ATPase [Firmicutes bacterium]|nr:AAA family ATPase [Bacillota bacterium]
MKKKRIPIGYEDFKQLIENELYFVDKSLLIQQLLDVGGHTTLITRPRRFGKTLNLSMIRRFFEDEYTEQGEKIDNGSLFDGLKICDCGEQVMRHQQQYPVISLSLKSGKQPDFKLAYKCLIDEVANEFSRHRYVLQSDRLSEDDKERYQLISTRKADAAEYAKGLAFLSECLSKYHQKKVIILIDEYDVPLENAYFSGFYHEMIGFIRSLFESALKTNPYLERGVITGCLRISLESIFTGLNNLQIHSVLSPHFADCFGFTPEETQQMLAYYDLTEKYPELKDWYDGYRFGSAEIYNPWSIINYVDTARVAPEAFPRPYWSNTSSNAIIRELVEEADEETRKELKILMDGDCIERPVREEITYGDIHKSQDNLWSSLLFTGYLKAGEQRQVDEDIYLTMSIPNREIKSIYRKSISAWFDERVRKADNHPLLRALEEGDCKAASGFLSRLLMGSISYFDCNESFYHGYVTGILAKSEGYELESNRESGLGRPDIVLSTEMVIDGNVIILELKVAGTIHEMEEKCREALQQIEEQRYAEPYEIQGYERIRKYAICFCRKDCMVRTAEQ